MRDVVDADACAISNSARPATRIAGDDEQVLALGHEVVVVRVGSREREHPPIARDAERLGARSTDARTSAAACSTALLEFMSFVYGNPIQRLSAVGRADLLGRVRALDPGVRVASGDLAEPGPQLRHRHEVLVDRAAQAMAQRLLEQRVHLHRHHDAACDLARDAPC